MTSYGDFIEVDASEPLKHWCQVVCEQEVATLEALQKDGKIPPTAKLKIRWQVDVVDP